MKDVNLSKRMETVVSMVSPQSFTIADVGCDHAYVSVALVNRKIAQKVIAMDVRKGPLDIARKNVSEAGCLKEIDIRLGDGLERLQPGEADTVIIAGMGGLLIKGILERGMSILSNAEKRPVLILQPQSDLKEVRMFLYQHAYHIVQEKMLIEDGKYYTVIKAEPDLIGKSMQKEHVDWEVECGEAEWVYGKYNLINRDEVLLDYLQKEHEVLEKILNKIKAIVIKAEVKKEQIPESTKLRFVSIQQEIAVNESALKYFEISETDKTDNNK